MVCLQSFLKYLYTHKHRSHSVCVWEKWYLNAGRIDVLIIVVRSCSSVYRVNHNLKDSRAFSDLCLCVPSKLRGAFKDICSLKGSCVCMCVYHWYIQSLHLQLFTLYCIMQELYFPSCAELGHTGIEAFASVSVFSPCYTQTMSFFLFLRQYF